MPYPGSVDALTLTVTPYDGTTTVTLSVAPPDGSAPLTPTPTSSDSRHTWVANPVYTLAGKWVATWTVTGTGAGEQVQEIWVSHIPAGTLGVSWRPDRWRVANYIPGRTLVAAVDGYGNPLNTFDDTTHPTGTQVDGLVTDACAWVTVKTGVIDSTLYDMASATAAVYAASAVERGYPDANSDVSTAGQLWQQALSMRTDLAVANAALTGEEPADPTSHLVPVYGFPPAVAWGDEDFF